MSGRTTRRQRLGFDGLVGLDGQEARRGHTCGNGQVESLGKGIVTSCIVFDGSDSARAGPEYVVSISAVVGLSVISMSRVATSIMKLNFLSCASSVSILILRYCYSVSDIWYACEFFWLYWK